MRDAGPPLLRGGGAAVLDLLIGLGITLEPFPLTAFIYLLVN